jgi:hypothetical protein
VATWFWKTEGRSAERVILGVRPSEFVLLELRSPSRRIFIGSHSLSPHSGRLIGPSSMSRHKRSSNNLHERQLEPHRQTTPELTHCPKTPCIDHMETSCQHALNTRTKEEIYHRKDRATSEDRSLEVAGFKHELRILYLPVTLFQDSTISILRRSAKVSMTTWGRKWALRIPTPKCYTNNSGWTRQDHD